MVKTNDARNLSKYKTGKSRILAAIIDTLVLVLIVQSLRNVIHYKGGLVTAGFAFIPYFYSVFLHYRYGQTIGKFIMRVKVFTMNEQPIQFTNSFLRDAVPILFTIVDLFQYDNTNDAHFKPTDAIIASWAFIELFTMFLNNKRRSIHDFIAGTIVIKI